MLLENLGDCVGMFCVLFGDDCQIVDDISIIGDQELKGSLVILSYLVGRNTT